MCVSVCLCVSVCVSVSVCLCVCVCVIESAEARGHRRPKHDTAAKPRNSEHASDALRQHNSELARGKNNLLACSALCLLLFCCFKNAESIHVWMRAAGETACQCIAGKQPLGSIQHTATEKQNLETKPTHQP